MLLLAFILLPIAFADPNILKINNYEITVAGNTLKSIRKYGTVSSDQLDLSSLGLQKIAADVFADLTHLKYLNLANNSLSEIPKFLFENLENLEYLSLADNKIGKLENTFVGLKNLEILNISNNQLDVLEKYWFYGLPKSCDIFTLGNNITNLECEVSTPDDGWAIEMEQIEASLTNELIALHREASKQDQPSSNVLLYPKLQAKICIQEGTVKLLEVFENNEILGSHCHKILLNHEYGELWVPSLNISNFESGWYRVRNLPIRKIVLDLNNIVQVTEELLNDLPKQIVSVSLASNKIERLKAGVIKNKHLKTLDFGENLISEIEDCAFENTNLKTLILTRNRLKNIKFAETLPLTIRNIILTYNEISEIPAGSLVNLKRLGTLDLMYNNITELRSQSFSGLYSLLTLSVSVNQIRKIEPGSFQDLKALRLLDLSHNRLDKFEKGVFDDLENIARIDVADNKLVKLTKDWMENLPEKLRELDLSYNVIERLETGAFVNVPKLILSLEGNRISKIEKGSFALPNLRFLELSDNLLTEINGDSFEGLPKLRVLTLARNPITKIEERAIENLGKPVVILHGKMSALTRQAEIEMMCQTFGKSSLFRKLCQKQRDVEFVLI